MPEAMTSTEAAAYLRISLGYLYRLSFLKKIPVYKPTNGKLFFKKTDLDAFLFRNRQDADYE
jgi:excisionase family DNA binding protein